MWKTRVFALLFTCYAMYSGFVYTVGTGSTAPAMVKAWPAAVEGKAIWQKHNCISCHQVYGLGGYLGPELTTVISKGEPYIRGIIRGGAGKMPAFQLDETELNALIAYLQYIDSTALPYKTHEKIQ